MCILQASVGWRHSPQAAEHLPFFTQGSRGERLPADRHQQGYHRQRGQSQGPRYSRNRSYHDKADRGGKQVVLWANSLVYERKNTFEKREWKKKGLNFGSWPHKWLEFGVKASPARRKCVNIILANTLQNAYHTHNNCYTTSLKMTRNLQDTSAVPLGCSRPFVGPSTGPDNPQRSFGSTPLRVLWLRHERLTALPVIYLCSRDCRGVIFSFFLLLKRRRNINVLVFIHLFSNTLMKI